MNKYEKLAGQHKKMFECWDKEFEEKEKLRKKATIRKDKTQIISVAMSSEIGREALSQAIVKRLLRRK